MATEGRPVTRVRASLTCIPCKRRKVKCDKQKPVCQQCRRTGVSCSYEAVPTGPDPPYSEQPPKRQRTGPASQLAGGGTGSDRPVPVVSLASPGQAQQPALSQNPAPSEADTSWASHHGADIGTQFLPEDDDLSFLDDTDGPSNCSANGLGEFFLSTDLITYGSAPLSDTRDHVRAATHPSASTNSEDSNTLELPVSVANHIESHPVPTTKRTNAADCFGAQDLDFGQRASRPLRFMPDNRLTGWELPACLSDVTRHLRRYVDSPFWALAGNQKLGCTALLQNHITQYHSQHFHERRWAELSKVLQALPSKRLCDVLLRSFLLGVRPILPLVHVPTLKTQYDSFWDRHGDRHSATPPTRSLREDPSFACLLWSVLYCGAVAASPDLLAEAQFRVSDTPAFLSRLRSKLNETLEICCQAQLPTLNGLVASLLAEDCDPTVDQILDMPLFISRSIQAARTMGLHREDTLAAMGEVEGDIGRHVWHHLIHLDVLATIRSGTTLSHSSGEDSYNTLAPNEHGGQKSGRSFPYQADPRASLSNIVATGKYELTRIIRRILETCYGSSSSPPPKGQLERVADDIERFEKRIDGLISMIEARGLPEHGQISSQLLSASPLTHGHLYQDDPHESAVFSAYCRIWLSMMKYYASVLFNRQFLHQTSLDQSSSLWSL
ncbi:hypothetical protein INS49_000074 [Diaporthe citri]|uniref:uncharacterized protein n=1 Tax=Diaporthe citri TaxID=83186 RepID=UPI001C7E9E44|nr:uncharacterized protein INS49_000074 [Diaporthe citri]KAG6365898.1 hypothetical protein INS49_000074 [Diaporthe citri]